jgi:hypothetical protein
MGGTEHQHIEQDKANLETQNVAYFNLYVESTPSN